MHTRHALGCLACVCASAHALTYIETTDFPNGNAIPGFSVGTLSPGANSVTGSLNGVCIAGRDCNLSPGGISGDSQDSFTFTVGDGTLLEALSISTSGVSGPAGFTASLELDYMRTDNIVTSVLSIPINGTSGNLLTAPGAPGVYSLTVYGQNSTAPGAFVLPHATDMSVGAVPEPASWVLLMAALTLTASARRRIAGGERESA